MKKIKFLPFLLLLSLCSTAPAFFTDSLVTGDANNLHIESDFEWTSWREDHEGYGRGGRLDGTWEGGSYTLSGNMNVLPLSPIELEVRVSFGLRTFWNDGYDPGWLSDYTIGTSWLRGMWDSDNSWQHIDGLTGFGLVEFVVEPDYSGTGTTTWDLSRTHVPDTGSTLAMFGMALVVLGGFYKERKHV